MNSEDHAKHQYTLLQDKDELQPPSESSSFDVESGMNTPRLSVKNYKNSFIENEVSGLQLWPVKLSRTLIIRKFPITKAVFGF